MDIPILRVRNLLLTSLQGDLTDEELAEFRSRLLDQVRATAAHSAVIDISAFTVVDSYMARVLSDLVGMLGLIGCRAVVAGVLPAVAITLVEMGRGLDQVDTALDLEHALEKLGSSGGSGIFLAAGYGLVNGNVVPE